MRKLLLSLFAVMTASFVCAQKVTLDLTKAAEDWGMAEYTSKTKGNDATKFSNGTYEIVLQGDGSNGFAAYDGYVLFGKQGASLTLPAFDFAVGKIVVEGRAGASGKTTTNVYVGETAVSTTCTGSIETNTFNIAEAYQAAGNVYSIVVENANNAQVTKILVYEVGDNETPNTPDEPEEPVVIEHITVAEFLAKADTETTYELTGTVANIKSTLYGNFDLVEGDASIYIYGLLDLEGNAKNFASLGIVEGTVITLTGKYFDYNGTAEIKNAQLVKIETGGETPSDPVYEEVTVTKALEIIDALDNAGQTVNEYIVSGKITAIESIDTDQYGNATFTISDGTNELIIFRCKDINDEKFTDAEKIKVGDDVKVQGILKKYVKDDVVTPELINGHLLNINVPDAISTIEAAEKDAVIYDLAGRRVQKAVKGLYIVNGKKVLK